MRFVLTQQESREKRERTRRAKEEEEDEEGERRRRTKKELNYKKNLKKIATVSPKKKPLVSEISLLKNFERFWTNRKRVTPVLRRRKRLFFQI